MIPSIGPLEIAIVLVIALIVFGPKRLPELGRTAGRGLREFRKSVGADDAPEQPGPEAIAAGPAEADAGAERRVSASSS